MIKIGVSFTLLLCLFLPLSECTYTPKPLIDSVEYEAAADDNNPTPEPLVVTFILIDSVDNLNEEKILFLTIFLALLILSFAKSERIRAKIVISSLQLFIVISAGYLLYDSIFVIADPLFGGIIFAIACVLYIAVTIFEWYAILRKQHNKQLHEARAKGARPVS